MSFSLANPVILTVAVIGFVLLCLGTVAVYWQGWQILRRREFSDLDAEQNMVEKLGGDPQAPIPPVRQMPVGALAGCVLLFVWPFLYMAQAVLGGVGFTVVAFLSLLVFWYLWERTVGFCKRVAAARHRLSRRS
ncbi:MAG TPA: hypothetical protein VGB25_11705 [Candidatus Binatia bacterium]